MGFSDTQIVDGQEQHAAEFTCTVCLNLVDAPLLTTCAHVFCTACLQDWFDTKPSCPTCSVELDPRHGAGRLQIASPLAWRVLGRLRMRCTVTGCGWVGEYSELTAHMTSDSAHQATAASPKPRTSVSSGGDATPTGGGGGGGGITSDAATAEALKDAGNAKFSQRIYPEARARAILPRATRRGSPRAQFGARFARPSAAVCRRPPCAGRRAVQQGGACSAERQIASVAREGDHHAHAGARGARRAARAEGHGG